MTATDGFGRSGAVTGTAPAWVGARTRPRARHWPAAYAHRLAVTDTIVVLGCLLGAQGLRDWLISGTAWWGSLDHTVVTLAVAGAWLFALHLYETRSAQVVGVGGGEARRIVNATLHVFGLFAIWSLLAKVDLGRGYLLVALPIGLVALIVTRLLWRAWLQRQRAAGRYCHSVVLLGSPDTAAPVAADLNRNRAAGYRVLGLVLAGSEGADDGSAVRVPVLGGIDDITAILDRVGADTVVVTGAGDLSPVQLRALGWQLEDERYNLIFTPSLTSVGGPRVHLTPVSGLALLHVDTPRYEGVHRFGKRAFDLIGALLIIAVLAIPMAVVALVIALTSRGPIFYTQERIGLQGRSFRMIKFRSMRVGADAELAALLAAQETDGTPLFKVSNDPRITPIGRIIRKYSIDEVPQLLNVVRGEMSLVGPRPQVPDEVALYDDAAHRRHIVQPGMTGLWQVSGRSALDWEDAIALDLHYVANWSVTTDIGILLRTVKAVVAPGSSAH